MFKCTKCGNVPHGTKEFRVIEIIRKVKYTLRIRYDKLIFKGDTSETLTSYKTIDETYGTEIVKEQSYCKEHIPTDFEVRILGEVKRTNTVAIKTVNRGDG